MISLCGEYVICGSTEDGCLKSLNCGFLHKLNSIVKVKYISKPKPKKPSPEVMQVYLDNSMNNKYELQFMAEHLHLPWYSLKDIKMRKLCDKSVWITPMFDEHLECIGLKCRSLNGKKWCVPYSKLGIYVPYSFKKSAETCYIFEGESDLAAAVSVGLNAIAKPCAQYGDNIIMKYINSPNIIIFADNDRHEVGIKSAVNLAKKLGLNKSVICHDKYKDFREWVNSGKYNYNELSLLKRRAI